MMKYDELIEIISPARFNKYLYACNGDKAQSVRLYGCNIQLGQRFFGVLNMFEVMLRNMIDNHYTQYFSDKDWILHQAAAGKLFENNITEVLDVAAGLKTGGLYNKDRMVSSFTLGFWTCLFSRNKYNRGGKTLLQIFPKKDKNTTQKAVYRELNIIRCFRNRIAHHEPIIFDSAGQPCVVYGEAIYDIIRKYVTFAGYSPDSIFSMTELPDSIIADIRNNF